MFSFTAKQKQKVFKTICLHENIPTPERLQESDSVCIKALKCHVVEMGFRQIDSSHGLET